MDTVLFFEGKNVNYKNMEKAVKLEHPKQVNLDLRSYEGYEENPFIVQLKGKMYLQPKPNTIIAKGEQIVDTATGEIIEDSVLMGRRKVVDRSQFAKIYFTQIQTIFGLSRAAIRVLMYMAERMDYNTMVLLNAKKESGKIGYKSQQAVQRAIKELLDCGIIAQGYLPGMYWMNPLYICKGERFAMYLEYTTKEYAASSEERRAEVQAQLKAQAEMYYSPLDEHTTYSMVAMDARAQKAWDSQDAERFEREFPGMSGEK